jgi:hypothetical protein
MKHKSDGDSYDGEVVDISVDESNAVTSMLEVEITDSDSDSKVELSHYTPWRHMGGEEV